jgi:methylmalonyl-CoA mutase cobalamin-binding domain/chain
MSPDLRATDATAVPQVDEALEAYYAALLDTDRARALATVERAVDAGVAPEDAVFGIVIPAIERMMASVGRGREVSLAQHFLAARIATEVTESLMPRFTRARESLGRVVLGNAANDFHGLGRRIVAGCLRALQIDVVDLGLDVSPERFVDTAVEQDATVIGVSSMMVHTARGPNGPMGVRRVLRERGLEDRVRLVVGGAPYRFDPELWRVVGADTWAESGLAAGRVIAGLLREARP